MQKAGRVIVINPSNDAEKDKDMVQNLLGEWAAVLSYIGTYSELQCSQTLGHAERVSCSARRHWDVSRVSCSTRRH